MTYVKKRIFDRTIVFLTATVLITLIFLGVRAFSADPEPSGAVSITNGTGETEVMAAGPSSVVVLTYDGGYVLKYKDSADVTQNWSIPTGNGVTL